MERPKRILVPVDLSARSEIAVDYAVMLASCTEAELVVMTNIDLQGRAAIADFASSEEIGIDEAAHAAIRRIIVEHAADVPTSIVVRSLEDPAEAILGVAAAESVDQIVLASHGRSGMTRWLLGSVAEKIARTAEVPVVIVPARG